MFVGTYIFVRNGFSIISALSSPFLKLQVFLPVFLILAFLHEAIHWFAFRIFGKVDSKHCRLGFQWKTITPYAHCSIPMKADVYRISLILPGLLLGIIPSIISIIFSFSWLLIYGIIFTIVSGGDFIILWLIRKIKNDQFVQDHPTRCGCTVVEKSNL